MTIPCTAGVARLSFVAALLLACQGADDEGAEPSTGGSAGAGGAVASSGGDSGSGGQTGGASSTGGTTATSTGGTAAGSGGNSGAGGDPGTAGSGGTTTSQPTTTLPFNEWVDITPAGMEKEKWETPGYGGCTGPGEPADDTICTYGAGSVRFDFHAPGDAVDAYVATNMLGVWRQASDGTWTQLGDPGGTQTPEETHYLPQVFDVRVDPADSNHLYLTSGVQGPQHGFYVSTDRGDTWTMPPGFLDLVDEVGNNDVTVLDVDPEDFEHILISYHSDWSTTTEYSSGVAESRDGGATWKTQIPPSHPWSAGTKIVMFLHHPPSGQGNGDTWLVGDEGAGFWRTDDAGENWEQVSELNSVHGGPGHYYTSAGVLYVGGTPAPMRSTDNGLTFEALPSAGFGYFFAMEGDGERLYTRQWNSSGPYMVSPESDGVNWEPLVAGDSNPTGDTFYLEFDPINRVLYSGNHTVSNTKGAGGVWALRLE